MKSSFAHPNAAAILRALVVVLTLLFTVAARAADNARPAKPPQSLPPPPVIDPKTGLPVRAPVWIDPDWADPDKVLPEVNFDGIQVGQVAEELRRQFNHAFDVLIPSGWQDPNNPEVSIDPGSAPIRMQLKNVRASEVFNAMNLMFEAENTPYRWELKLNGTRPTAMLRVLPQLLPVAAPPPPLQPKTRMVYFVGDLIDDTKPGGMTIERVAHTVTEIYAMAYGEASNQIRFHKGTQLLIVTGTSDQITFVQNTLSVLRTKAQADKRRQEAIEPNPKPEEKKAQ